MANFSFYEVDGEQYARVSTILGQLEKPALIPWAVGQAIEYVKKNYNLAEPLEAVLERAKTEYRSVAADAADIGSEIHGLIENYIKNGVDPRGKMRPEVENGFLAFLEWEQTHGVKWLASEKTVYDSGLCVAGTVDAIAEIDGRKYLIDFKSSKAVYDEYKLQVAAYLKMYENEHDFLEGAGILRLDKETGIPEWVDFQKKNWRDEFQRLWQAFSSLADFWYFSKNRRIKNRRTEK